MPVKSRALCSVLLIQFDVSDVCFLALAGVQQHSQQAIARRNIGGSHQHGVALQRCGELAVNGVSDIPLDPNGKNIALKSARWESGGGRYVSPPGRSLVG